MAALDFLQWWNLIFVLPFLAALGYLVLMASGTLVTEASVEADVEADHDVDLHEASTLMEALSFLGFGKVPVSLIMMCFCFVWGFAGWTSNQFLSRLFPVSFIWLSLAVALLSAVLLTRYLTLGLARVLPTTETYGVTNRQLVGKLAEVRYTITESAGRAQLHDEAGRLLEVPCRLSPGEMAIPPGSRVLLLSYDAHQQAFVVCRDLLQV